MENFFNCDFKLGILGGGQLGRMLIQSGIDFNISFVVLDPSPDAPCRLLAPFTIGSLTDYNTVMQFGDTCDVITIELENVNTEALKALENKGKKIFPQSHIIQLIQDKRLQKQFFVEKGIPTSEFVCIKNREEALRYAAFLPAVNKLAKAGYDGRGVQMINSTNGLKKAFDAPGILERLVDIDKELAVLVVRNEKGDTAIYPPVEMTFYTGKNMLEQLLSPAQILPEIEKKACQLALKIIDELQMVGILAVEMFLTKAGEIQVNELAPRPHNSGHHTIEACATSQYEQHLRAILSQPLGNTYAHSPSALVNLLGSSGCEGRPVYKGIKKILSVEGVHLHLYGKKHTKPFRKMGHVTILDQDLNSLKDKINFVKNNLSIIT